jgi:hypothetical protein
MSNRKSSSGPTTAHLVAKPLINNSNKANPSSKENKTGLGGLSTAALISSQTAKRTRSPQSSNTSKKALTERSEELDLDETKNLVIDESFLPTEQMHTETASVSEQVRLPSIKITLTSSSLFKSQMKVAKEIIRIFPNLDRQTIKFAKLSGDNLIIATDNKTTHDILSGTWPADAFNGGLKQAVPKKTKPFELIIKNVDLSEDLLDADLVEQFKMQGIQSCSRIINAKSKKPTSLVKLFIDNKSDYNKLLADRVYIGFCPFKPESARTIIQCFKCQAIGHTHTNCHATQRCLKCSGPHAFKDCKDETPSKCANCGGPHFACARICPAIKAASNNSSQPKKQQHQKTSQQQQQKQPQPQKQSSKQSNTRKEQKQPVNDHSTKLLTDDLAKELGKYMPLSSVKDNNFSLNEILEKVLLRHLTTFKGTEQENSESRPRNSA